MDVRLPFKFQRRTATNCNCLIDLNTNPGSYVAAGMARITFAVDCIVVDVVIGDIRHDQRCHLCICTYADS
jgi:hypothetical protein